MKCSNCGKEMRKGYLFSSKDGAFSFANEVPGVFENAKNADGFVEITKLKPSLYFEYNISFLHRLSGKHLPFYRYTAPHCRLR